MAAAHGKLQEQQQQEDALAVAQNGGISSSDEGDMDGDGEDLDDDMMDRISSSPSIEDGEYSNYFLDAVPAAPGVWPRRVSSLSPHLRSRSGPSNMELLQALISVTPPPVLALNTHVALHGDHRRRLLPEPHAAMPTIDTPSMRGEGTNMAELEEEQKIVNPEERASQPQLG